MNKSTPQIISSLLLLGLITHTSAADDETQAAPDAWPHRWVTSLAGAGDTFYAGSSDGLLLRPSSVVRFSPEDVTKSQPIYDHPVSVWAVATSSDGSFIASSDYKGHLAVYDTASKKVDLKESVFERWTRAIAIAPNNKHLVAGNEAGKVFIYSFEKNEVIKSAELDGQQIYDVAFSPDGKSVACGDGAGHVHLLKFPSLEPIKEVQSGDEPVWAVEFSADGKSVFAGGADRRLRTFEVAVTAKKPEPKEPAPESKPEEAEKGKDDKKKEPAKEKAADEKKESEPAAAELEQAKEIGKASDWITTMARSATGDIAVATMDGKMYTFSSTGFAPVGTAPSGIWSVAFTSDKLLVGTRKHMVATFIPSWKLGFAAPSEGE